MATMLSFVTTDCAITPELLQRALRQTVDYSYNLITVDGDTSTNDMALVLANGMAQNPLITEENDDFRRFVELLQQVNTELAQKIVRDGEGASKFLEVTVKNAPSYADGKNSPGDFKLQSGKNGLLWRGCQLGTDYFSNRADRCGL